MAKYWTHVLMDLRATTMCNLSRAEAWVGRFKNKNESEDVDMQLWPSWLVVHVL